MPAITINGRTYEEIAVVASTSRPLPVDIQGATLSLDAAGVEIANDSGNPIPVSDAGGSITVDGPLTNAELRASAVPTVVPARIPTTTSVASSATSVTVLAANADRKGLSIFNDSTATLYLSFSTPATTVNEFIAMAPGSFLLLDQQLIVANAIYGIWSAANGTAQVTQYI
jgi:UDP:flavonoid glycosyltransferase YjiC (YdhE family)